ncbi:hypothetical protein [Pararhizobium sp.]|uniref:hypothetical protein n=1 Tax=Pararhizobium sp. TaxID=1977563 RepID=UPI002720959D|nr:hypothetical protein [Pararhizobium sp.]MDO9416970.1 hypothetical protein [Pararhizobium sp.]
MWTRRLAIAALALCAPAFSAFEHAHGEDDKRTNAMQHITKAMAIAELCPRAEVNHTMVGIVFLRRNIDATRDEAELLAMAREHMKPLEGKSADEVCTIGLELYGREGSKVPKLLIEK